MKQIVLTITMAMLFLAGILNAQTQIGTDIDGVAANKIGSNVQISGDGEVLAIKGSGKISFYGFNGGNWTPALNDINTNLLSFSMNSNGSVLAVGDPDNDTNGTNTGQVRVYKNTAGVWTQIGNNINGLSSEDYCGKSVSLNDNGNFLAVGSHRGVGHVENSGHVRVFQNISNSWIRIGNRIEGDADWDQFGKQVRLSSDGSVVAIGADGNDRNGDRSGHVKVFKNIAGIWTQIGNDIEGEASGDESGAAISLNADGSVVAIGAIYNDGNGQSSGHVRIFKNENNTWVQIGNDIDGEAETDYFGKSVSLSADGSIVAIGGQGNDGNGEYSGHVRIFKNQNNNWVQVGNDIDGKAAHELSGISVSLCSDGSKVAIGAPTNIKNSTGKVRVYNTGVTTESSLTELPFTIGVNDRFKEFDIDGDGEYDYYAQPTNSPFDDNIGLYCRYSASGAAYEWSGTMDQKQADGYQFASIFNKGTEINADLDYNSSVVIAGWNSYGEDAKQDTYLDGKREGYLGCRIAISEEGQADTKLSQTPTGQYKYAWIHVLIDDNTKSVTFLSSGYNEEPDAPIPAGDSPVVPIPILASILGFGVIGFSAMRKRIKN